MPPMGITLAPKKEKRLDRISRYYEYPSYQKESKHTLAGGKKSTATLGPHSLVEMGTNADSDKPGAIKTARDKYPDQHFKAGHLLNADFGGAGDDPKNLTILTAGANARHKNFDNPIKEALRLLLKFFTVLDNGGVNVLNHDCRIRVEVEVSDEKWGTSFPDNCICQYLQCRANMEGNITVSSLKTIPTDAGTLFRHEECFSEAEATIKKINELITKANFNGQVDNTKE